MSDQSTAPVRMMTKEASLRGHNKLAVFRIAAKLLQATSSKGPRRQGLRRKIRGSPRKIYCLFCGENKGHTTRTCQITIQKQKEIAEAEAQQNQPKQVLHTASYHSPYILEYVGNQPTTSVALASHSQASWPQLPPPPPLQPTYTQSQ
jgi:hypothetical protein